MVFWRFGSNGDAFERFGRFGVGTYKMCFEHCCVRISAVLANYRSWAHATTVTTILTSLY